MSVHASANMCTRVWVCVCECEPMPTCAYIMFFVNEVFIEAENVFFSN